MATLIPVVPAKDRRDLHVGTKGNDVKAYGRLVFRTLKHMGLTPANAQNGVFGDGLLKDTLLLQRHEGIKATGHVGLATWTAVDPQMHAYERLLLKLPAKPVATHAMRKAAVMRRLLILGMPYYSQRRPGAHTIPEWDRIGADCSLSEYLADNEGNYIDGYGNTGTIWADWDPVSEEDAQIGDAIIYGSNGVTHHVAEVSNLERKLAIGFGSAPGRELPWRYRNDLMGFRRSPKSRGGK